MDPRGGAIEINMNTDKSKNKNQRARQWAERAVEGDALALDPIYRTVCGEIDRYLYAHGQLTESRVDNLAALIVRELRSKVPGMENVPDNHPNKAQRDALSRMESQHEEA